MKRHMDLNVDPQLFMNCMGILFLVIYKGRIPQCNDIQLEASFCYDGEWLCYVLIL